MDMLQREGTYRVPLGASDILGLEFSGVVEQLGPGVTKWAMGDEVFGLADGVSTGVKQHNFSNRLSPGCICRVHRIQPRFVD